LVGACPAARSGQSPPIANVNHQSSIVIAQSSICSRQSSIAYSTFRYLRKTVASPRKEKNPNMSVSVVMKTDEASAGSTFSAR
jgi:hypothetical protein